ncbi:hypothetical protein [Ciceribacter naphthalenivorans]|nr:hypothetical protein [Ciceribacter naphthalenivorans]
MLGDPPTDREPTRYVKFAWRDLSNLPPIGKLDYAPKRPQAFRIFQEGEFEGRHTHVLPAIKRREVLPALGRCVYCRRQQDACGRRLNLTSEHVIPEFLGAGLELAASSCFDCQRTTSDFESSIAASMFGPVRRALVLKGKGGILERTNFPLDIGREISRREFIPLRHYPTILVMPNLYPASSYSRRSPHSDDLFNFQVFNVNAEPKYLRQYDLEGFSSQSIDLVRFCQMIAKIAVVYGTHYFGFDTFNPTVVDFVRTDFPPGNPATGHFANVGCLWRRKRLATESLHEIEVGEMRWQGKTMAAVRVQLFASYGMPSYYVTIGE